MNFKTYNLQINFYSFTSFFIFGIGAVIPVVPFFFTNGMNAVYISIEVSILGLL